MQNNFFDQIPKIKINMNDIVFDSFTQNHVSYFDHDYNSYFSEHHNDVNNLNLTHYFGESAPWIDHIVKTLITKDKYDHVEGRATNYFNGISQLRLILYDGNYESLRTHPNNCVCYNISSYFGTITVYKYSNLKLFLYFNDSKDMLYNEIRRYDNIIGRIILDLAGSLTLREIYKCMSKYTIETFNLTTNWTKIFTPRCFTLKKHQTLTCNFENMCDGNLQIVMSQDSESINCELNEFIRYCKIRYPNK